MIDAHYDNPRLADLYDLDSGWSADRDFYLSLPCQPHQTILDLGCGTGLLCNAYAARHHVVTGVDPSGAMLSVARRKPFARDIEWVQSPAQTYRSDKLFDLIIMTGHAFQVLLHDLDVQATFWTIRKHLKPGGLLVFESRNPAVDWARTWDYDILLKTPAGDVHEARRFVTFANDRMTFELRYRFPDETLVSRSILRFMSRQEIQEYLGKAELFVAALFGDWDKKPFDEKCSPEMIFMASSV